MKKAAAPPQPEYVEHYGFHLPAQMPEVQRHIWHCYHGKSSAPIAWHREQVIHSLWPTEFIFHDWSTRRIEAFSICNWCVWTGCAGIGKSSDAAALAIQWWLEAPHISAVIICSTSVKMLRKRVWSDVSRLHQQLPAGHGELIDSDTMIRWRAGDTKNAIFGMAVEEGSVDEVINNLIGIHTHRVLLILDECQGIREAILQATRNMAKNPVFKFLAMGNPERKLDPLGRLAEPIGGWDSIKHRETKFWEIHPGSAEGKGRCDSFVVYDSPAYKDENFAKRNPWMTNRKQYEQDLRACRGNEKDPKFQSQTVGWWPDMGMENTVLDEAICVMFKVQEKAVWTHGFRQAAAFDPAFEGGDRKVIKIGRFGEADEITNRNDEVWDAARRNRWVIEVRETIDVPIDSGSDVSLDFQIADFVVKTCKDRGIPSSFFGMDVSGRGQSLKAIIEDKWAPVIGVHFGGFPSDDPVNGGDGMTCRETYDRKCTELHMQVREFALSNGLRGLTNQSVKEHCSRRTELRNKKQTVESKGTRMVDGKKVKGFKERLGHSPDESDTDAILVAVCRQHGAVASLGESTGSVANTGLNELAQEISDDWADENYMQAPQFEMVGFDE